MQHDVIDSTMQSSVGQSQHLLFARVYVALILHWATFLPYLNIQGFCFFANMIRVRNQPTTLTKLHNQAVIHSSGAWLGLYYIWKHPQIRKVISHSKIWNWRNLRSPFTLWVFERHKNWQCNYHSYKADLIPQVHFMGLGLYFSRTTWRVRYS